MLPGLPFMFPPSLSGTAESCFDRPIVITAADLGGGVVGYSSGGGGTLEVEPVDGLTLGNFLDYGGYFVYLTFTGDTSGMCPYGFVLNINGTDVEFGLVSNDGTEIVYSGDPYTMSASTEYTATLTKVVTSVSVVNEEIGSATILAAVGTSDRTFWDNFVGWYSEEGVGSLIEASGFLDDPELTAIAMNDAEDGTVILESSPSSTWQVLLPGAGLQVDSGAINTNYSFSTQGYRKAYNFEWDEGDPGYPVWTGGSTYHLTLYGDVTHKEYAYV